MSWGVAGGPRRWTWSNLDVEGTYPGNGRVNTPCVQTLQSLGTVTGASHQEIRCRLHNPDIESRVMYMCCGGLYDSGDNEKDCMVFVYNWTAWFLNQISLYVSFCDDHLFGGSRCGCSVKDISGGWRAIVLVLKRRFPVGASLAVVNSTEFISLV